MATYTDAAAAAFRLNYHKRILVWRKSTRVVM